jgi:hypothetical protein
MPESVRAHSSLCSLTSRILKNWERQRFLPAPLTRRSTNMAEGADVGGLAMAALEVSSGFHMLMCCHLKILHGKCE